MSRYGPNRIDPIMSGIQSFSQLDQVFDRRRTAERADRQVAIAEELHAATMAEQDRQRQSQEDLTSYYRTRLGDNQPQQEVSDIAHYVFGGNGGERLLDPRQRRDIQSSLERAFHQLEAQGFVDDDLLNEALNVTFGDQINQNLSEKITGKRIDRAGPSDKPGHMRFGLAVDNPLGNYKAYLTEGRKNTRAGEGDDAPLDLPIEKLIQESSLRLVGAQIAERHNLGPQSSPQELEAAAMEFLYAAAAAGNQGAINALQSKVQGKRTGAILDSVPEGLDPNQQAQHVYRKAIEQGMSAQDAQGLAASFREEEGVTPHIYTQTHADGSTELVAVNKDTGEVMWRAPQSAATPMGTGEAGEMPTFEQTNWSNISEPEQKIVLNEIDEMNKNNQTMTEITAEIEKIKELGQEGAGISVAEINKLTGRIDVLQRRNRQIRQGLDRRQLVRREHDYTPDQYIEKFREAWKKAAKEPDAEQIQYDLLLRAEKLWGNTWDWQWLQYALVPAEDMVSAAVSRPAPVDAPTGAIKTPRRRREEPHPLAVSVFDFMFGENFQGMTAPPRGQANIDSVQAATDAKGWALRPEGGWGQGPVGIPSPEVKDERIMGIPVRR